MWWRFPAAAVRTKDYEADVRVCGTQRILCGAAIHGAVQFCRHSFKNQLPSLALRAAIQHMAPHLRPGEERLWENLILSCGMETDKNQGEEKKASERGFKGISEKVCVSAQRLKQSIHE